MSVYWAAEDGWTLPRRPLLTSARTRWAPNLQVMGAPSPRRLSRLAEELEEAGLALPEGLERELLLKEVDRALRPQVHEGRVPNSGTIVNPQAPPATWSAGTGLEITEMPTGPVPATADLRRFIDGLSSWLCRTPDESADRVLLFDRPVSSERDLVVLARTFQATVVQRHPSGVVRVVGPFGVLRWEGLEWRLERHVGSWLQAVRGDDIATSPVVEPMLVFAVHDLAAAGIGAVLIARKDATPGPGFQDRLSLPPRLHVGTPEHLGPLRHALAHVDGAAIFDEGGWLRRFGVILAPSTESRYFVPPIGGARHTSAARYSYDDPSATVIVVSEDGPVTVLRAGGVLAQSRSPLLGGPDLTA